MWEYSGPTDSTRTKADELSRDDFDSRIRAILNLSGEDTPVLAAMPLSRENPPVEVIFGNFLSHLFFVELNFLTSMHFLLGRIKILQHATLLDLTPD